MSTDELKRKRDAIEANMLAMGVCLAQQQHLLELVKGCIANPSKDNLDILERQERDHRDWLVRMASDHQSRPRWPSPCSTAKVKVNAKSKATHKARVQTAGLWVIKTFRGVLEKFAE